MKIQKVHCFFEQSGTFKNAFKHFGIVAEDYDIQNNFGETENVIDLFNEIEAAYDNQPSIFDRISKDDLIFAFFPCIHFCDYKTMFFKGISNGQRKWSLNKLMSYNISLAEERHYFYILLMKLFSVVSRSGLKMILENPYNKSCLGYLQTNFIDPTIIDHNRRSRGDFFQKSTGYWFVNIKPLFFHTYQSPKKTKTIEKTRSRFYKKGICDQDRSMISFDYALNFIKDNILGCLPGKGLLQQIELF